MNKGSNGDAVRGVPALSLDIPSVVVDGIVGPVTWQALVSGMIGIGIVRNQDVGVSYGGMRWQNLI